MPTCSFHDVELVADEIHEDRWNAQHELHYTTPVAMDVYCPVCRRNEPSEDEIAEILDREVEA